MTTKEVKKRIKDANGKWSIFLKWMNGQTVGMYSNGDTDWYEYDVGRFIKYNCNPNNEPLKDFD